MITKPTKEQATKVAASLGFKPAQQRHHREWVEDCMDLRTKETEIRIYITDDGSPKECLRIEFLTRPAGTNFDRYKSMEIDGCMTANERRIHRALEMAIGAL